MLPSGRSDSTHTRTGLCPVLAVLGPSQTHRSRGRLRLCLAGSPVARAVSSSLSFRTNLPLPAAPHPALPRRSCLPLPRALCLPEGNDFHILSSWFHGRTRRPRRGRGRASTKVRSKPGVRRRRGPEVPSRPQRGRLQRRTYHSVDAKPPPPLLHRRCPSQRNTVDPALQSVTRSQTPWARRNRV
jgi:hypothetical protein